MPQNRIGSKYSQHFLTQSQRDQRFQIELSVVRTNIACHILALLFRWLKYKSKIMKSFFWAW